MARVHCAILGLLHASSGRCPSGPLDTAFQPAVPRQTVSAQGPFAPEAIPSFLATTSPCADPSASHLHFDLGLVGDIPAACAIHGWSLGSSRFGSAPLCWSAAPLTPAARRVLLASSSSTTT